MPKNLLRYALVCTALCGCFYSTPNAYSAEISTSEQWLNAGSYDANTKIMKDITLDEVGVPRFYGKNIGIYGQTNADNVSPTKFPTIDGKDLSYDSQQEGGTGISFFQGSTATIKDIILSNFTHRQRGTVYINNSSATLDNVTINGYAQEITDGHIWGHMVAVVDGSTKTKINNSTFQNVDLTLNVSKPGGEYDSDGGVLHVQGSQSGYSQSTVSLIENTNFLNNKITANRNIYGGAVYNEGIIDKIFEVEFDGNKIDATGALTESVMPTEEEKMLKTGGFGGAFSLGSHNSGRGIATIKLLENTKFNNNSVTSNEGYARGGALWSGDNSVIGEIQNVVIDDKGKLQSFEFTGNGGIINCEFTNNNAVSTAGKASGGAIYNNGNIGKIVGSTFENNYVQSPNEFGDDGQIEMNKLTGAGGAIFTKQNITIQDGTTFSNNSVKYGSGDDVIKVGNDIHLSFDNSKGANLVITTSDKNDAKKNFVTISSGIASTKDTSTITIEKGATLNLSGVNQFYIGQTNITENSILNFTQTKNYSSENGYFDTFLGGTVKVDSGSVVNFNNTYSDIDGTVKNLIGGGTFNKTGDGSVEINNTINTDKSAKFTGYINLDRGSLTVHAAPQTTKGQTDFTADIADGTTFTYNNGGWSLSEGRNDYFTLNKDFGLKFDSENSDSTLNFRGHGTFTVTDDIEKAAGNNISFTDATISFASNTYNANYEVNDSTITLQDDKVISNVIFNNSLTANAGSSYKIDFDFTDKGAVDTLTSMAGNTTLIIDDKNFPGIKALNPQNDKGQLAGQKQTYQALTGATFANSYSKTNLDSDVYRYTIASVKDTGNITLIATALQDLTLYKLNHKKDGDRYFYFLGNAPYSVKHNLEETLAGTLYVKGKDDNPANSIITGDNQYSFFFQNNGDEVANLFVNNVTLQNGNGNGIAAVLDVNENYTAAFDNVVLKDNVTTGGKASVISNNGGTVTLKNTAFELENANNTGAENFIYNSGQMNFETTADRKLTYGAIGAAGNKIKNDTNGTMNFVTGGNTYTIKSAIENNGTINITNNSTVALTNNSGITGSVDGIVNVSGDLNLTGNTSDIVINSGFSGSGNITKDDSVTAVISGNNSGFKGNVDVNGGTLKFTKTNNNAFFNKDAVITVDNNGKKGSTLDYTTNLVNETLGSTKISLENNAKLIFSGRDDGSSVVKISENIVKSDNTSNELIFNNADYTIGEDVNFYYKSAGAADNITFNNAKTRFEIDDYKTEALTYDMGNANWELNDSEFRFLNKIAGDKYQFENLTMNNSKISLDLDLTIDKVNGKKPYADTFTATGGDGGVVEIIRIGITADNGEFYQDATGALSKGIIQVFTDPDNKLHVADVNNATILHWGTNVYKYGIKSASSGLVIDGRPPRELDSIEIVPKGASTTGTLRDLNRYDDGVNRGFSFIVEKDASGASISNDYNIYRDLDTTSAGTFSVIGTVDETLGKSVLDGTLENIVTTVLDSSENLTEHIDTATGQVDYITYDDTKITADSGLYEYNTTTQEYTIKTEAFCPAGQTQGSMFEIEKETDFYMSDLVAKNAKRYASDKDKPADRGTAGIVDGSVIYAKNADATITLENVDLESNSTETGNGGAIANHLSKSFEIKNMQADNNTAGELGGAIYTASDMNIIDSDFGTALNDDGTFALNRDKNGQNDIYIAGADTKLIYSVSKDNTTTINSGLAGDGQFVKTGDGTLNLNGKNDNLTGVFAVDKGKALYAKDNTTDSFATGNVRINSELEMKIADTLDETIQNVSSDTNKGKLVKTGEGTLNLAGDNSGFIGSTNIEKGSVIFTAKNDTAYFGGVTNIAQSADLNYIANKTSKLDKVAGQGTVNYSGTSDLTFNAADNKDFAGVVNANGTQLNVTGLKTDAFDFDINIQSGKLNYTAAKGANLTLNNSSKVGFKNGTTGAQAIFDGGSTYTLDNNIKNVTGNTVTFDNTTVKVAQGTNTFANGSYELQNNAILSLIDKAADKVSFDNLSSDGGKLSLDVNLKPLYNTPDSDVLNVQNGTGTLTLTSINVLNERNNKDNGLNSEYSFGVIEGGNSLTLNKDESVTKWATSVYEYDVDVNDTGKGIIMTAIKASDENSLKAMNQYEGTRGFQFRADDTNPYKIGSDLGITKQGTFTVNGVTGGNTVISGNNQHSFFDVQNATKLAINDVTITNAKKSSGTGAVINAVNKDASIELNNVTLQNNFDANGKNDIYIAQGAKVSANNSAINSGLSGDGTFDANNSTLSGKNDKFTGILNVSGNNGLTYTQTDAEDSYISGTTNVGVSSVTLNIDKGNTTAGNFTGTGTITKTGAKDISVSGNNSGFTGDVNINKGTISYNADNTKYFGGKTILAKDGGLKVTTNNGTGLSKISGNGTLSKSGSGALTMTGDNSGFNGNLNINDGTFALAAGSTIGQIANGTFENGTAINLQNTIAVQDKTGNWSTKPNPGSFHNLTFDKLALNGNVGLNIDVDLKNTIADTIAANKVSGNGHLILGQNSINVVSDTLLKNATVRIASGAVANGNTIILSDAARTVMGPIQKYDVTYANGNLGFSRHGGYNPSIDSVNPSVMASVVATQVGGHLTQLQTLQDAFFHMDRYTKYPSSIRLTAEMRNKNAIADTPVYNNSLVPETSQAMWVKPYTSFEKVQLKGGVGVSNVVYGALYGGDSDLVDLGHGCKGVISAFVGYNGAHQSYNGISMNQQGGTLGVTGTLYKGNFFTGVTISTGASAGEAYTPYGQDNFAMMTAGAASKTGYNWEIKDGKMIIQPSLFLGYTFVNTFDYRNAAGVRVDSDPLNAIQIVPGLKVIGNLDNGWQPYAGIDMVWNVIGKTNVMANDVRLPQLSVKPYVQYGVGVQKSWGERFTAFFQTMIRNGGRTGIVLSAGLRWVLGKDPASKPSNNNSERKVIKQIERT